MSSICKKDGPPHTHADFVKVLIHMNDESIALGVLLIVGAIISVIPQHIKIWKSRSTEGLSCIWMFLGNVNQYASVINAVVMKFPQIQACFIVSAEKCAPSMLALIQMTALWVFTFPIFIWYLLFSNKKTLPHREWMLSRVLFIVFVVFVFIMIAVAAVTLTALGDCGYFTLLFGYSMGLLSTIITFVQWMPQIWSTYKAKKVGSFSILMLLIQCPGSFITIYFLIFASHENVSTWLSWVCSAVQQVVLLSLLCFYDRMEKRRAKRAKLLNIQDEEPLLAPTVDYDSDATINSDT